MCVYVLLEFWNAPIMKYYPSHIIWQSSSNVFIPYFGDRKHQVALVWET